MNPNTFARKKLVKNKWSYFGCFVGLFVSYIYDLRTRKALEDKSLFQKP